MTISTIVITLIDKKGAQSIMEQVLSLPGVKEAFILDEMMLMFLKRTGVKFFELSENEEQLQISGNFESVEDFKAYTEALRNIEGVKEVKGMQVPEGYN